MRRLDHPVLACETLAQGVAHVEAVLDQRLERGGEHPLMGTHNRLLSLGPGEYLEVIARNPDARGPEGRKRWYGLDDFTGPPRIVAWCARAEHFVAPPGTTIIEMTRGSLRWQFTLPDSDQLPGHGTHPLLIHWHDNSHPCDQMGDRGLRLLRLAMTTPEPKPLAQISDPRITLDFGRTALRALIRRPDGAEVWL